MAATVLRRVFAESSCLHSRTPMLAPTRLCSHGSHVAETFQGRTSSSVRTLRRRLPERGSPCGTVPSPAPTTATSAANLGLCPQATASAAQNAGEFCIDGYSKGLDLPSGRSASGTEFDIPGHSAAGPREYTSEAVTQPSFHVETAPEISTFTQQIPQSHQGANFPASTPLPTARTAIGTFGLHGARTTARWSTYRSSSMARSR